MVKKVIFGSLFVVLALNLYWFWQAQVKAAQQPVNFSHETYVGSANCVDCHKDRHRSWEKTYHRTMTQEASATSVVGDFNGEPLTYWGYQFTNHTESYLKTRKTCCGKEAPQ